MESRVWEPNSKPQEDFISLPFSVFEGLYGGAAGGGKSEIILMLPLVYGFHNEPRYVGITFRRTFPELEKSLILLAKEIYIKTGAKYNEQKHSFTWPSGATHFFSYLETYDQAKEHDTNQYNLICWDELTHFDSKEYFYLSSRCRTASNLPAIMRAASNPGNIGHLWVFEHFVKPAPKGGVLIKDTRTKTSRVFIQAKATDNPHLMESDPGYLDRLQLLPAGERRAKIDGDWFTFEGQVFDEFRMEPGRDEPENAQHVIKPFQVPSWWSKIVSIDWGYAARTVAYLGAIDPESHRLYVVDEARFQKVKISVWANELNRRWQYVQNIVDRVIDPSAKQMRGDELSIYDQVIHATKWKNLRLADNDRISGKLVIHELLRWQPRPPKRVPAAGFNPSVYGNLLRTQGLEAAREYEQYFIPDEPELNLPKCQIFDTCEGIIRVLPTRTYDKRRIEDVAETEEDDEYDSFRYLCKAADRYLEMEDKDGKYRQRLSQIEVSLSQTGNQTAYYRRMEKLEAGSRKNRLGIPRSYSED